MAIAVLTSGGDSPGMNACLRAVVRKSLAEGLDIYGVSEGFRGLYLGDMKKLNRKDVAEIINRGGTFLKSARFPEFENEEIALKAVRNAKALGIDTLFVIGGNGSYKGGMLLAKLGLNVINIPGTIDNDILGTEYTLGFDTAVNTAVEAVDKMRDTSSSHFRASVIEVMGRHNGDIAFRVGLACGAEEVLTIETGFDADDFIASIKDAKSHNKGHVIVIMSENLMAIDDIANIIHDNVSMEVNKVILGHIQRGGTPTAYDRMMATRMGHYAVELYLGGYVNVCVAVVDNKLERIDFDKQVELDNSEDLILKKQFKKIIKDVR